MATTQAGYSEMKPNKPGGQRRVVSFHNRLDVHKIEPIETNSGDYSEYTILLALEAPVGECEGPILARPLVQDSANQRFLALRPENARKLAHQHIVNR